MKNSGTCIRAAFFISIFGFALSLCAQSGAGIARRGHPRVRPQARGEYRSFAKGTDPRVQRHGDGREEYPGCRNGYAGQAGMPAEVTAACMDAMLDAKEIAIRRATACGCEDGYFSGFSKGLWDGAGSYSNDPVARMEGRNAAAHMINTDPELRDAAASAYTPGENLGKTAAAGDIRILWMNALGHGIPAPAPAPKAGVLHTGSPFNSSSGAYGIFYPAPLSIEQIVMEEPFIAGDLRLYSEWPRGNSLCMDYDLMRPKNEFRLKDYYAKDGHRDFDRNRAIDGKSAFEGFVSGRYRSLNASSRGNTRYIQLKGKVVNSQGEDQKGSSSPAAKPLGTVAETNGRGIGGLNKGGTGGRAVSSGTSVSFNLEEIYKNSFVDAYQYYADKYYSSGFYEMRDDGYDDGFWIGAAAGRNFSGQQGFVEHFNTLFRSYEQDAFSRGYSDGYVKGYADEYDRYLKSPIISATLEDVVGLVDDGILQPGESVYAVYAVRNFGGVEGNLQTRLQGAGIRGSSSTSIQVPAMSSMRFEDRHLVAAIHPDLKSLSAAEICLSVTGGDQPQLSPISRTVTHWVTLESTVHETITEAGIVNIKLALLNRSPNRATNGAVKVLVSDNNGHRVERILGVLQPNERIIPEIIVLAGNKPLDIYRNEISYTVQLSIADRILEAGEPIQVREPSDRAFADLAAIFDQAARDSKTQDDADAELALLVAELNREVESIGNNVYKDRPDNTLLYAVMTAFRAHPQSAAGKSLYSELARRIRPLDRKLNAAIYFRKSRGRQQFLSWMKELSR